MFELTEPRIATPKPSAADEPVALREPTLMYQVGDATQPVGPGPHIIAHVCSDSGTWDSGFTRAVSQRWPEPEAAYRLTARTAGLRLGALQRVKISEGLWVFNLIAQTGTGADGPRIDAPVLAKLLESVARSARFSQASVHLPRETWGLTGEDEIGLLIAEKLAPHVATYVYTLPEEVETVPGTDAGLLSARDHQTLE